MSCSYCHGDDHASEAHVDVIEAGICAVVACARGNRREAEHWQQVQRGISYDAAAGVRRGKRAAEATQ